MISSFSDAGTSCLAIRDHAFFEQPQFKGLLGDDFLQVLRLPPELIDLIRRSRPCRVPRELQYAKHDADLFFA